MIKQRGPWATVMSALNIKGSTSCFLQPVSNVPALVSGLGVVLTSFWHGFGTMAFCLLVVLFSELWQTMSDLKSFERYENADVLACAMCFDFTTAICGGSKVRYVRHGHLFFRSEGRTSFLTSPLYIALIHITRVITYNNNTPPPFPSIEWSTRCFSIMIDLLQWYLKEARETARLRRHIPPCGMHLHQYLQSYYLSFTPELLWKYLWMIIDYCWSSWGCIIIPA